MKAYLSWRQVEFPKTHSIREILNLIRTVNPELAEQLLPAAALTPYAVQTRYPDDLPEPSLAETEEALDLARSVQKAVLALIGPFSWNGS